MKGNQLLELVEPTENMAHQILEWRNHPEIRRWMINADEISREDHLNWWSNTNTDPGKYVFVCQDHKEPRGIVNFDRVSQHQLRWVRVRGGDF